MTKKRKRRLRFRLPQVQSGTSTTVKKKKRRRRRFRLRKEAYLVLAGIVAVLCLIFIPRAIDNNNLKKLGYDKETIKAIREQKLTKTVYQE